MSKLIGKHWAKLASRLEPKPLQPDISKILADNVMRHDPKSRQLRAQYSAHFDDLFSGLTSIQGGSERSLPAQISSIGTQTAATALELFKTAYYHGSLTPKVASAALSNPKLEVYEIASMFRLVEEGGTLIKWMHGDRLFFELQAASVLWKHGYQPLAKNIIGDSIREHHEWIISSIDRMHPQRVRNLVQALRASSPDLAAGILAKTMALRPLWIMWAEFRGKLRSNVLERLRNVVHYEILDVLEANPNHRELQRATPATESQAVGLFYRLELLERPQEPQELFSLGR